MKILQINNSFEKKGGAEVLFLNTIELLRSKGELVIPFSKTSTSDFEEPYKKYFLPVEKSVNMFNRFYSKESVKHLRRILDEEKPDIAHIHNIHGEITFSILPELKKRDIPIVATIHGFKYLCPAWVFINGKGEICEKCKGGSFYNCVLYNCSQRGTWKSIQLSLESYLRDWFLPYSKLIDRFIFVSKFTMQKFLEFNPSIEGRSYQIYNFTNDFNDSLKGKHSKYFLYLGRLDYEKGIETLISAFKNLVNQKLIIAGSGPLKDFVNSNLSKNIEYVGFKAGDEAKSLIENAFYVVVPSECYENNPMTIVESYSRGKPVIGTNLGGIPEIVEIGKSGFLFEPKNHEQLSKIVMDCSRISMQEYESLSNNALEFAQINFNPENHYKKLTHVYKELIENKN